MLDLREVQKQLNEQVAAHQARAEPDLFAAGGGDLIDLPDHDFAAECYEALRGYNEARALGDDETLLQHYERFLDLISGGEPGDRYRLAALANGDGGE